MPVSACLIIRDEERYLPSCLSQLTAFADEIVIVDTGSTDRSLEIANSYGARVFHSPWENDFAAARNLGLTQAHGDWILYIDADELLQAQPVQQRQLTAADAIAATVRFCAKARLQPYRELRLFRNRPDIRFSGAIHETIRPAVTALVQAGEGRVVDTDIRIDHRGYEGDLSRKRTFRTQLAPIDRIIYLTQ